MFLPQWDFSAPGTADGFRGRSGLGVLLYWTDRIAVQYNLGALRSSPSVVGPEIDSWLKTIQMVSDFGAFFFFNTVPYTLHACGISSNQSLHPYNYIKRKKSSCFLVLLSVIHSGTPCFYWVIIEHVMIRCLQMLLFYLYRSNFFF